MARPTIATKLAVEGEKEYKSAIKTVNSELGTLKSELKLVLGDYQRNRALRRDRHAQKGRYDFADQDKHGDGSLYRDGDRDVHGRGHAERTEHKRDGQCRIEHDLVLADALFCKLHPQ